MNHPSTMGRTSEARGDGGNTSKSAAAAKQGCDMQIPLNASSLASSERPGSLLTAAAAASQSSASTTPAAPLSNGLSTNNPRDQAPRPTLLGAIAVSDDDTASQSHGSAALTPSALPGRDLYSPVNESMSSSNRSTSRPTDSATATCTTLSCANMVVSPTNANLSKAGLRKREMYKRKLIMLANIRWMNLSLIAKHGNRNGSIKKTKSNGKHKNNEGK